MSAAEKHDRSVSINDIARATGVSRSAVSRALNDQPGVTPTIRDKVKTAATSLGYVKDVHAQALKTQHTRTIGLLVRVMQLADYAAFIAAVQQAARRRGYQLAVVTQDPEQPDSEAWHAVMGLRPEAVIVASGRIDGELLSGPAQRIPVVLTGPTATEHVGSISFGTHAAHDLTREVAQLGHRHAVLLVSDESRTVAARCRALRQGLTERRLEVTEVPLDPDDRPDAQTLREAVAEATVLLAPSDPAALAAWEQLTGLGISVPGQISVVGFGGATPAARVALGLSTVVFPIEEAAELAVAQVMDRLVDPHKAAAHVVVEGKPAPGRTLTIPHWGAESPAPTQKQRRIGAW